MFEILIDDFLELDANATEVQRDDHHEMSKEDEKYLFLNQQCVDSNVFRRSLSKKRSKMHEILSKSCTMRMRN